MTEVPEVSTTSPIELLSVGRRHLAVRDFSGAAGSLAKACELLAQEHGDTADQCAEAYLWYGKALLGLSREESGVLGDGVPGSGNVDNDDEENEEQEENGEGDTIENGDCKKEAEAAPSHPEATEPESTTKDEEPSKAADSETMDTNEDEEEPGPSNGDVNDESEVNLDNEDDVDNLQLAWEMLDLSRSILLRRVADGGTTSARALLADVHLALGEVALESETYDKAVVDMPGARDFYEWKSYRENGPDYWFLTTAKAARIKGFTCLTKHGGVRESCLELQKELYESDDRRIAETHYQIGLANSLASNFEDAITHFKNAANILETRIKTLENPPPSDDAADKKTKASDPFYSAAAEIKELKELLPEIQEKIQDMMDYKAETVKRVREALCPSNGDGPSSSSSALVNGASSSTSEAKPAASDISHLIKRKRKSSESDAGGSAPKRANT